MNFSSSHQRNIDLSLFGLLANRFLNVQPRAGAPEKAAGGNGAEKPEGHQVPHDDVSAKRKEVREKTARYKERIGMEVDSYNDFYHEDFEPQVDTIIYETLILNFSNLNETKKQIASIIKKLGEKLGPNLNGNEQYLHLNKIFGVIDKMQKLPARGKEAIRQAHRGRLYRKHAEMIQAKDQRELWEKKDIYKQANKTFNTLAATKEFRGVWQDADGLVSQRQRESRELFMAIIAEKTGGFEKAFVLGDKFKNNFEDNIRNFPYIYSKFLEHAGDTMAGKAVSLEIIQAAQAKANEARAKLQGLPPAKTIIDKHSSAGIDSKKLPDEPGIPATEAWGERVKVLNGMVMSLKAKASSKDYPQPNTWINAANQLSVYKAHSEANLALSNIKDREKKIQSAFTRSALSSKRTLLMELAMQKFMKAQNVIDFPYGNADWRYSLHPTVRRMLVANAYETGVVSYKTNPDGTVEYDKKGDEGKRNVWMLSTLALSNYFSFKEVGKHMDADHEAVLKAAYLGGHIAVLLERSEELSSEPNGLLTKWIDVQKSAKAGTIPTDPPAREKYFRDMMGQYPPEYVKMYSAYNLDQARAAKLSIRTDQLVLKKFLEDTQAAVRNPYTKTSQKFIADIRKRSDDPTGRFAPVGAAAQRLGLSMDLNINMSAFEKQMFDLQINFKTAELEDKNMLQFFKGLGMNIEGMYPFYLERIAKNPKLKAENWERLLLGSDAEFKELLGLFRAIIPGNKAGGKEDFLQGLVSLRKKYKGEKSLTDIKPNLEEGSEDAVILNVFKLLQLHMSGRAEKAAVGARKAKEIDALMGGMHVGDKITKYVAGVWDMLVGPGQSAANRAAGLVLMYGFYKIARRAMKGEGKDGKIFRALFVATSIEIALKNVTGRGGLDRLGFDDIGEAMAGTYEEVLRQDAAKEFKEKGIEEEAHGAALMALNDVPFHQVMTWYETSDKNGMPEGWKKGGKKEGEDHLPQGLRKHLGRISTKMGVKADSATVDKEMVARRVLWETVRHFFGYVGNKDNKQGIGHGKNALKERWITMVDKPGHKPVHSTYNHSEWLKASGTKKSDISWQLVMRAEIDPSKIDLTKNKTHLGKLKTTAEEWYDAGSNWVREHVYNPGSDHAKDFFKDMTQQQIPGAKDFFAKMAEETKTKIYFGKEKAILWYGAHQYEIRRVAKDHWDLVVVGLTTPFKIAYAVDRWAVPWTLTNIKRIEESLKEHKFRSIDKNFSREHIIKPGVAVNSTNLDDNEHFRFYGLYQGHFLRAFENGHSGTKKNGKPMYHEDLRENVGYYITDMTPRQAGINKDNPLFEGKPENVTRELMKKSRERAVRELRKLPGMDIRLIEEFLYPIHRITKTKKPKRLITFWRMPLDGSVELELKRRNRWPDYKNPNKHKDRQPFKVDPSQSSWENIQRTFALGLGKPIGTLVSTLGPYVAQVPRFIFAHMEFAGRILKSIGRRFNLGRDFSDAVDAATVREESTRQFIDELFESGESDNMAMSKFYQDKTNARLFDFSRAYARKREKRLSLKLMEGRRGNGEAYEGTYYLKQDIDYDDMLRFYNNHYIANRRLDATDRAIAGIIRAKQRAAGTP